MFEKYAPNKTYTYHVTAVHDAQATGLIDPNVPGWKVLEKAEYDHERCMMRYNGVEFPFTRTF